MSVIHGTIGEFNSSQEDWASYTKRLQQYFAANDIAEDKQKPILLSACRIATYRLIKNLTAPANPADKSFAQLVKLVGDHHSPKPSVIVERFRFNTRIRQQGESVVNFIAELRHLTRYCEFGSVLNDMLRDRLVRGIENSHIQQRLLSEPNLTLDKAVEISLAMESADRNAKDLQKTPLRGVNAISPLVKLHSRAPPSATPRTRAVECYRCKGPHLATECQHKHSECKNCKKKGHLARVCRSKKAEPSRPSQKHKKTRRANPQHTNSVVAGDGPSLLGRDWLSKIRLNWAELYHTQQSALTLQDILDKHQTVFSSELGMVREATAKLHVDPQARPKFYRPRSVPYAMREKVDVELDRLLQQGIIEPVQFSNWIVPVLKQDGNVRIVGITS